MTGDLTGYIRQKKTERCDSTAPLFLCVMIEQDNKKRDFCCAFLIINIFYCVFKNMHIVRNF